MHLMNFMVLVLKRTYVSEKKKKKLMKGGPSVFFHLNKVQFQFALYMLTKALCKGHFLQCTSSLVLLDLQEEN